MTPETTKSPIYTVGTKDLCAHLKCCPTTLYRYTKRGLLPPGKRREGVRGLWWTKAKANDCIEQVRGCTAERFNEF